MTLPEVLAWGRRELAGKPETLVVAEVGRERATVTLCTSRSGVVSVLAARESPHDPRPLAATALGSRLLPLARANPARYGDATVEMDGHGSVTAATVLAALDGYAGQLAADLALVFVEGRHPDSGRTPIVLLGDLADAEELRAALSTMGEVTPVPHPELLRSVVPIGDEYPDPLALRTRAIRGGRLRNQHLEVAAGGSVRADSSPVECAVEIRVEAGSTIELGRLTPEFEPIGHPPVTAPDPGRYTVGVRLVRGVAELVFTPSGGAPPAVREVGPLPFAGSTR